MTADEVAAYLKINLKSVYHFANHGDIPATRIGNKWLFPKRIIDEWIFDSAKKNVRSATLDYRDILLSIGSNDPFWEILSNELIRKPYDTVVPYASVGSAEGLRALGAGKALLAGIHLYDPATDSYNRPFLPQHLSGRRVTLIHLFNRRQGLMVRGGNPKSIRSVKDLTRSDVSLVNRRQGTGTRQLLDFYLTNEGFASDAVRGYDHEVDTHFELALSILEGKGDAGIGIEIAARYSGLDFIPLKEESYDIVLLNEYLNLKPVQVMLDFVKSQRFRKIMEGLPGYDISDRCSSLWEGTVGV